MTIKEGDGLNYLKMLVSHPIPSEIERACRETVGRHMDKAIERAIASAFGLTPKQIGAGTTTSTAGEFAQREGLTIDKLRGMLRDVANAKAQIDRTAIVVVLIDGHPGPMLMARSPATGIRVECSWEQAGEIHKAIPLRIKQVISADIIELEPADIFSPWALVRIPRPPFETGEDA